MWGVSPSHPLLPHRVTTPAPVVTLTQAETPDTLVEHPASCHPHPLSARGIHTPLSFEKKKRKSLTDALRNGICSWDSFMSQKAIVYR